MESKQFSVYKFFDESDELLYIGRTGNLLRRIARHTIKTGWFNEVRTVRILPCASRYESVEIERREIMQHSPKYNQACTTGFRIKQAGNPNKIHRAWGELARKDLAKKARRRQQIKDIYLAGGKTMAQVAAQFRISEGRVWQIVRDYQK